MGGFRDKDCVKVLTYAEKERIKNHKNQLKQLRPHFIAAEFDKEMQSNDKNFFNPDLTN